MAGHPFRHGGRLCRGKTVQLDFCAAIQCANTHEQVIQRMPAIGLLTPCGSDHEQVRIPGCPEQIVQKLERFAVAPLKVVSHEQQWWSRCAKYPSDRIEDPAPLIIGREWIRTGQTGNGREQLGEQPGKLGHPWPIEPAKAG